MEEHLIIQLIQLAVNKVDRSMEQMLYSVVVESISFRSAKRGI